MRRTAALVDEVLALAAAMQPPRDRDLAERQVGPRAVGVVEEQVDLARSRRARRLDEPAKRTSSGFSARSSPGLIEPVAQRIESETFDLPEPFGPTTTATPGSSRISTGSTNDLKPRSLIAFRCTRRPSYRGRRGRRLARSSVPLGASSLGSAGGLDERLARGVLLGVLLRAARRPCRRLSVVDHRGRGERAVVRRPFDVEQRVRDRCARAARAVPAARSCGRRASSERVLDLRLERLDDRPARPASKPCSR